jgi:hypothetical protein
MPLVLASHPRGMLPNIFPPHVDFVRFMVTTQSRGIALAILVLATETLQ